MVHIVNDRASTEIVTIHRSTRPGAKAGARTTPGGLPVHGFDPLLHDLATLTLNHMNLATDPDHRFEVVTEATPLQQKAFSLPDISADKTFPA